MTIAKPYWLHLGSVMTPSGSVEPFRNPHRHVSSVILQGLHLQLFGVVAAAVSLLPAALCRRLDGPTVFSASVPCLLLLSCSLQQLIDVPVHLPFPSATHLLSRR